MATYGFEAKWEKVGPKKAIQWLETMGDTNRDVRQTVIDDYAAQMKAGLWRRNPQPVIFNQDGVLVDGQHRCWAVVESQTEIDVYVVRGMDNDDVVALDRNVPRSYRDVAHYQGWNSDPMTTSMVKYLVMAPGMRAAKVPHEIAHKWYEHYQPSIDFAIDQRWKSRPVRGKDITLPMAAAIARAHCSGVSPELLTRFVEILKTGQIESAPENAAFVLRDAWLQKRLGVTVTDQYFKTEAAIRAFVDRRPIKTLQRPAGELFGIKPLPVALRYETKHTAASPRAGQAARRRFKEATAGAEA